MEQEPSKNDVLRALSASITIVGNDLNRAISSYNDLVTKLQVYISMENKNAGKE